MISPARHVLRADTADTAETDPSVTEVGSYRAHLDGLRAVAVYLVVAFHGGSGWLSGGFVGVDVFFVLSGYLVTQLLLRDLVAADRGRIRLGRFYARRFRRLLPAAAVVLITTALVFTALASPVEVADSVGGFQAAFLYVTNWYFVHQSADYFGADLSTNPVLHFWSLAVEEQFYLVWPLLLGGLWTLAGRIGRHRWGVVRMVVAVGALASVAWALHLRTTDPIRAYYGTDARAYQLLVGALLALSPAVMGYVAQHFARLARWVAGLGLLGLLLGASSWVHLDAVERGIAVTVLTVVLLVTLEADGGVVRRVLATDPVVYLGKVSYGTYLWHWPVILVIGRSFTVSSSATIALTVLVATALASLSYQLMEHPIRISALLDRIPVPVIATGLALSAVSALVIVPAIVEPRSTSRVADPGSLATSGFTPLPAGFDADAVKQDRLPLTACTGEPVSRCTLARGGGARVLLVGDSHAGKLIPAFLAIAKTHDLTLSAAVSPACPWQRDLYTGSFNQAPATARAECRRFRDDLYDRVIPALDPDLIVVMNRGFDDRISTLPAGDGPAITGYLGPDGKVLRQGSALEQWLTTTTTRSLEELRDGGREVVLVESIPNAPGGVNTLSCLSAATVVQECRYVWDVPVSASELLYRELAETTTGVWSVDLDRLVCPFLPICDPIVDGHVVTTDGTHLTRSFSAALAASIDDYLTSNRILRKPS